MTRIFKLPSALFAILTLLSASACPPPSSVFDPSATTTTTATPATTTTTTTTVLSSTTTSVSTTSVSSTSSSSTSSTSSTSTTLATPSYDVSLSVDNVGLVGGMTVELNFTGPTGSFDVISGTTADCSKALEIGGATMLANRNLPGKVTLAWIDVSGFTTPTALASCRLSSTAAVTSADFSASVIEAVNDSGTDIAPDPVVTVTVAPLP